MFTHAIQIDYCITLLGILQKDTEDTVSKRESILLTGVIASWVIIIAYISLSRSYFGFGTETDYLGAFFIEAQRLLSGEPLTLDFHPPFYAAVLALFQFFLDDWFLTGRIVSLVSYSIALVTSFHFFKQLAGKTAGWGALFALMASSVFVYFSTLATSDVFFYALYSTTLLMALLAYNKNSLAFWGTCGVLIGIVILSRSNGFTLLALLLLPWISNHNTQDKLKASGILFIGILFPLLTWAGIANYWGSPFMPAGNYINLALTYFPPGTDRLTGDARVVVESQFHSLWQVLSYDPMHMLETYFRDLIKLIQHLLFSDQLIGLPIYFALIPGVALLLLKVDRVIVFYICILTLSQALLINLKFFEARYFLFLVPLYGVALAICFEKFFEQVKINILPNMENNTKAIAITALIAFLPAASSINNAINNTKSTDLKLDESVTQLRGQLKKDSWIVARKPHMAFYNNGKFSTLPNVNSYSELNTKLAEFDKNTTVYVYFGLIEAKTRPQFKELISGNIEKAPWLSPLISSNKPDQWVLYKYTN